MIAFFEVLACIADSLIGISFVSRANGSKLTGLRSLLFALIYFAFNVAGALCGVPYEVILCVDLFILWVFAFVAGEQSLVKKILSPVCVLFATWLINGMVGLFFSVFIQLDINLTFGPVTTPGLIRIYFLIVTKIIIMIALKFLLSIITKKIRLNIFDWILMLVLPLTIFFDILMVPISVFLLHFNSLPDMVVLVIITLGLSYGAFYWLIYRLGKSNVEKQKRILYEQMLGYEEKRYEDMDNMLEQIRKVRHDMNHQLTLVKLKLSDKKYEEAEKALDDIMDGVSAVGTIIKTDNRIVDYMVNTKLGRLPYASVVVTGSLEELSLVNEMDLSIVLGNIIDNAVEAVKDMDSPRIELAFYPKENYMNVICKNTVEKPVLENNPDLLSSKADKIKHGYGLRSVKEIIERVKGDISFSEKDGFFEVHIMLPMKREAE